MSSKDVMPSGYDAEDSYFHQQDTELLKKKRAELDAARKERADDRHENWMKCPKCPGDLEEIEMDGIMVDKCSGCGGVFFDQGEVDLLLEAHKGGFSAGLRKLIGGGR
jgi:hypothetical protein